MICRASIELGSGCIRLQVAEVHTGDARIVNVLYIQTVHIEFARDLKIGTLDHFSEEIMDEAVAILKTFKEKALSFSPYSIIGVATEAFRRSKNANTLINRIFDETGVFIKIATQEEEARYGFFNAKSLSNMHHSSFMSWDTGAASFQITSHEDHYLGSFGRVPVEHYLIENVQKKNFATTHSANPVSKDEALEVIDYIQKSLKPLPKKMQDGSKQVIAIGAHPKQITMGSTYTKADIEVHLINSLDKTDADFNDPDAKFMVVDLLLAYSVMSSLNIDQAVRYSTKLAGNTSGLLIHPELWV